MAAGPSRKRFRTNGFKGKGKAGPSRRAARTLVALRGRRTAISEELKFHDLDIDDAVIATAGTIAKDSCNLIAQGITESTRVGRKCTIKSIHWRYEIGLPEQTDGANGKDVVRVIVYLDKQCNGATAAVLDILETADYQSFNNLSNKSRFRTLMDKTCTIRTMAGQGDGTTKEFASNNMEFEFHKLVNFPIEFSGIAGLITEIKSNNIGVLTISSNGLAALRSKMRLRYSDS